MRHCLNPTDPICRKGCAGDASCDYSSFPYRDGWHGAEDRINELDDKVAALVAAVEYAADTLRDAGKAAQMFNQHALSELFAIAENDVRDSLKNRDGL